MTQTEPVNFASVCALSIAADDVGRFRKQAVYGVVDETDEGFGASSMDSTTSASYDISIKVVATEAKHQLEQLMEENEVLRRAVVGLWRSRKYSQEFIAYLQGGYTDDEFMEVARSHAIPVGTSLETSELTRSAHLLSEVLREGLSSVELAAILGLDTMEVERAFVSATGEE